MTNDPNGKDVGRIMHCLFGNQLYRVARKKRPELSHGVMQQNRWNESAEKHVCNEETFSNMSMNFHL